MRIERAEVVARRVPLVRGYRIAGRSYDAAPIVFVTLEDEAGHFGYGAASPEPPLTGDDFERAESVLQGAIVPAIVGHDVSDLDDAVDRASRAAGGAESALAALDIALHDLHAKRRGIPLVEMLGGARRRLVTSVTVGIDSAENMTEQAARHVASGFRAIKVKIGEDVTQDLRRLRAIRAAIGPDVRLRVDANEGYAPDAAIEVARSLLALRVELFEQPVSAHDVEGMARVAHASAVPVILDEAVLRAEDVSPLAAAGCGRGAVVKLMKCGGLTEARRLDAAIAKVGWSSLVGCMDESRVTIAAAAAFAASAASPAWIDLDGHLDLADDPFVGGFEIGGGEIVLGTAPGLGVRRATAHARREA
ncbi:MAG: dipeptide epimerase [Planctomycetes bacterium]|nr:dipeptide epimerase [Planctomycetota bacterium]MBI3845616.1 dipeptide epimerase [Planctomycetota bacterium]